MKVFPVLFCLVLIQGISGSFLSPWGYEEDIRSYLPNSRQRNQHSEERDSYRSRGNHNQNPSQNARVKFDQHERDSQKIMQDLISKNNPIYRFDWQDPEQQKSNQLPFQSDRYQQRQQSQEQDSTFSPIYKYQRSSSSESTQNSQESKERRGTYNNLKSFANAALQQSKSSRKSSAQENKMSNSAENSAWKPQEKQDTEEILNQARNAMEHLSEDQKRKNYQVIDLQQNSDSKNLVLNATQLAQQHQYHVDEHNVTTDDGYVLTVLRILPKKNDEQKRPVVFLMHGLLGSADDWLIKGPEESLAYSLSDAGYDVWLGNARGNKYCQHHVSKSPAMNDFWQYSTDEIALHDLPAMIDYVLATSNQRKLCYIGHSLGNTAFFALAASRPEYNNKINMMYALSPMVYMTNVRSPLIRMIAPTNRLHQELQEQLGYGPFAPGKQLTRILGGALLEQETGSKKVASNINFVMAGFHRDEVNPNTIQQVMQHLPAGTSSKVIKQYSQGVASQEFQRFDYGPTTNQKVYGSEQPPKYDVQNVQVPVALYYSEEDWLAHPKDVERLKNELPNVRDSHKVSDKHFSNMDFLFSSKAPEIVYSRVIQSMQNSQQ